LLFCSPESIIEFCLIGSIVLRQDPRLKNGCITLIRIRDYLAKPVQAAELYELIERIVPVEAHADTAYTAAG
jgi:hypothetical protein